MPTLILVFLSGVTLSALYFYFKPPEDVVGSYLEDTSYRALKTIRDTEEQDHRL